MSDEWRRPDGAPRVTIDVPLLDADGHAIDTARPDGPDRPPTEWRRVVGVASVAGSVLGIVVAVIMLSSGDDDNDDEVPTPTTLSPQELETAITTPPTLPPPGAVDISDMDGLSSQDRILFDPVPSISAPQYPNFDLPDDALSEFDLGRSLEHLADDRPRRSTTRYEVGEEAYRIEVTIEHDPANGRYALGVEGDGPDTRFVIDVATGTSYVSTEAGTWTAVPTAEIAGDADLPTEIERLLRGPVRVDTVPDAVLVTPGPAVTIRNAAPIARRFAVTLRAGQVPEWARYQLGAVADAPPPDPADPILFYAYVGDGPAVVEVSGTFPFGNTEQLVIHRIETLPDDFVIELPVVTPTTTPPASTSPSPTSPSSAPSGSATSASTP